jgi:3-methyladenine DNA glycosylase/8-oxoguanine DNA glycosylase
LADSVRRRDVVFDKMVELNTFEGQVTKVPGIGVWTAQYVAMRALGQPDAFPVTDLGLLKGASSGSRALEPKTLLRRAEKWRPFRAYAAMYLWKSYGIKLSRKVTKR